MLENSNTRAKWHGGKVTNPHDTHERVIRRSGNTAGANKTKRDGGSKTKQNSHGTKDYHNKTGNRLRPATGNKGNTYWDSDWLNTGKGGRRQRQELEEIEGQRGRQRQRESEWVRNRDREWHQIWHSLTDTIDYILGTQGRTQQGQSETDWTHKERE